MSQRKESKSKRLGFEPKLPDSKAHTTILDTLKNRLFSFFPNVDFFLTFILISIRIHVGICACVCTYTVYSSSKLISSLKLKVYPIILFSLNEILSNFNKIIQETFLLLFLRCFGFSCT